MCLRTRTWPLCAYLPVCIGKHICVSAKSQYTYADAYVCVRGGTGPGLGTLNPDPLQFREPRGGKQHMSLCQLPAGSPGKGTRQAALR